MLNHVLLEVICLKHTDRYAGEPLPANCPTAGQYAGYHCLCSRCRYLDFTSCENTLCYIGPESDMEHGILYGGDMEDGDPAVGLEQWRQIAIAKIDEAYDQFMEEKAHHKHDLSLKEVNL